jgi:hypothetical protein
VSDSWAPGSVCISTCRCGVRLIAGDAVELERLKGEHADFHAAREEEP